MSPGLDLLICTSCRVENAPADASQPVRPGRQLLDALEADPPPGFRLIGSECLSNCSRGCTLAMRGPGRWTYVYGNLDPARHLPEILDGVSRYRATPDGLVPWRERPDVFRRNCIARLPPLEVPNV